MHAQIALAHGSVVIFEGHVGHVFAAAGLADTQPRAWVRALLPEEWAMVRTYISECLRAGGARTESIQFQSR